MNYFAFRYWWLLLLIFIFYIIFWYFFCFKVLNKNNCDSNFIPTVESIKARLDSCCACSDAIVEQKPPLYIPRENCRVHFTGGIMGGKAVSNNISKIYRVDNMSEYVGEGEYTDNRMAFPKAVRTTFDGIAIDSGTRLIIYSGPNFTGRVLLDVTGPRIINNSLWRNDSRYAHCNTDRYPQELEATYPPSVRQWSSENMHSWSFGSCKITCRQ
ncbi:MAG: hypothetical protein FJX80_00545 [Bacteroidetes bacterium]|nr:hypothetical protein [Bacteroidota bacterium]